jgi:hypothetical protein
MFIYVAGVALNPLLLRPFIGVLYQPWMVDGDNCGAINGMNKWQGKPKYPEETCPSATLPTADPAWLDPGSNPGRHGEKPETNCLRHSLVVPQERRQISTYHIRPVVSCYVIQVIWRSMKGNKIYAITYILRVVSSGMLRRVAFVRTNVSEELSASFIRLTRIGELGTTLAVTSNRRTLRRNRVVLSSLILVTLMKEKLSSSETSVLTRAIRRNITEDTILHGHRRENLKSYIHIYLLATVSMK